MEETATPLVQADLIIKGASELLTCVPGVRDEQGRLAVGRVVRGAVAARDGRIVWVGPESALLEEVRLEHGGETLDADGRVVMPGLVECHSHLAWAGDRADEFQLRVGGATYQQVQEAGGGIASTVHATRNASDDVLRSLARKRLDRFLRYGVTTVEAKSGYGLSQDQEIRLLEVYRDVSYLHPVDVVPTLLAAHVVPVDYADRVDDYVKLMVKKIIPAVAKKKLARFCDAFCERRPASRKACWPRYTPISCPTWAAPRWPLSWERCRWTTWTT
jgi:imidazolonepropionase